MHAKYARRLSLESLESRDLMAAAGQTGSTQAPPAAAASLTRLSVSEGVLVIRGSTGADKVTVHERTHQGNLWLEIVNAIQGTGRKETFFGLRSAVPAQTIVFFGGSGNDYFQYFSATNQPYSVAAFGEGGQDNLWGSGGMDVLVGGDGADWLHGLGGTDLLFGQLGTDYLRGDDGNDQLWGGGDRDDVQGGRGIDYLDGGNDGWNDLLTGSAGADIFRRELYVKNGQTLNRDYPADYQPASGDGFSDGSGEAAVYDAVHGLLAESGISAPNPYAPLPPDRKQIIDKVPEVPKPWWSSFQWPAGWFDNQPKNNPYRLDNYFRDL